MSVTKEIRTQDGMMIEYGTQGASLNLDVSHVDESNFTRVVLSPRECVRLGSYLLAAATVLQED